MGCCEMTGSEKFTYEFPEMSPRERLRELILYIAEKLKDDPKFGRTKLAKIIYFADMESFRMHRLPVSGSAYVRSMPFGPLPKGFLQILDKLKDAKEITENTREYFGFEQKRITILSEPTVDLLSQNDMEIVDRVIEKFTHWNASGLSERSHGVAWQLSEGEQFIPYEYALYSDEPLTEDETARAQELALKYRDSNFE